jgi:hypothetical protein
VLSGLGKTAQLHGQAGPVLAIFPPEAEQSAQQSIIVITTQVTHPDLFIPALGDEISILQNR